MTKFSFKVETFFFFFFTVTQVKDLKKGSKSRASRREKSYMERLYSCVCWIRLAFCLQCISWCSPILQYIWLTNSKNKTYFRERRGLGQSESHGINNLLQSLTFQNHFPGWLSSQELQKPFSIIFSVRINAERERERALLTDSRTGLVFNS